MLRLVLWFGACLIAGPSLSAFAAPPVDDPPPAVEAAAHPLVGILTDELRHEMEHLATEDGTKPYYLAYAVTDIDSVTIATSLGALYTSDANRGRVLDVDLRVGDYGLDNTREIRGRGGRGGGFGGGGGRGATIPIEDDPVAIRHALWRNTDRAFDDAVRRYQSVQTNMKTTVREEDDVHDFSTEKPSVYREPRLALAIDRGAWEKRLRSISELALKYPLIYDSQVALSGSVENRILVTSEGTTIETSRKLLRVYVSASTKAEDGMDLSQSHIFDASIESGLPDDTAILAAFQKVIDTVLALREAPLVEPYTGPAILMNRASGVFFHEIFGHRIEGHRQKSADEGQTFTKMIGKPVLPEFLSVVDDPTVAKLGAQDLRGFYRFDDEGVPAQRVGLVEDGVLRTFLMSRSPLSGFDHSNGHGRREPGRAVVSRQGNLTVQSTKSVSFAQLEAQLREECKRQEKPFGYLFEDITGGFTTTTRGGPQAFKVLPIIVYKVFVDGRPDELVRGVDIVGTPLTCFSRI
ncbi:MAG: peptidase U62, partial [Planctomycetes bacterium]|nr:peptidase U62 [Planctomycetota bacterium]